MGLRAIILCGLVMVSVMPVRAQTGFGIRAGLARSSLTQKLDLDYRSGSRLGYSVGLLADIPFYRRFSFRPELSLVNQGGTYLSLRDEEGVYGLKYKCNYYSLQTFLNVAFNIPISGARMAVYGGLVPDIYLGGKMKTIDHREPPASHAEEKMKAFDLGLNGGIGVEYKSIFFSIGVVCGTIDRRKHKVEEESSVYQNNLTFSMGYFFR